MQHDLKCIESTERNRNMLIPWVLMAQYLYYYRDETIMSDGVFDTISRRLHAEWDSIEHIHKSAIAPYVVGGKPQLERFEYPVMSRGAACRLAGIEIDLEMTNEDKIIFDKKESGGIFDFF